MPRLYSGPTAEADHSHHLTTLLTTRYAGRHPAEHVAEVVVQAHSRLAEARIQTFVPILAERMARDVLDRPLHPVPTLDDPADSAGTPEMPRPFPARLATSLLRLVATPFRRHR